LQNPLISYACKGKGLISTCHGVSFRLIGVFHQIWIEGRSPPSVVGIPDEPNDFVDSVYFKGDKAPGSENYDPEYVYLSKDPGPRDETPILFIRCFPTALLVRVSLVKVPAGGCHEL